MNQAIAQTTATVQRAQWLISLGCSPLPVAPAQAEPQTTDGKPVFNGKNPSYLDASGKAHLIRHTQYRDTQPNAEQLKEWFTNPSNGIGTLAGQGGIDWIDLDRKNFESQEACDNARALILEKCDRTYFESTKSGGAHIAVKLSEPKTFTNFELGTGTHAGEFLGQGRFVVLAPTQGYTSQNGDEIASVQSAEVLGLAKVGRSNAAATDIPDALTAKQREILETNKSRDMGKPPVPIERLISSKNKEVLNGKADDDVSKSLARLARELFAVSEWYPGQLLPVSGDADALLKQAAEKLQVDSERLERILQGISRTGNIPALVKHGGTGKAIAWFRKQRKASVDGDEVCSELKKIRQLRKHYEGRVRLNELTQRIEIDGVGCDDIEGERIYYIEQTNKTIGVDFFCSVMRVIGTENSYHPVRVYLEDVAEKSTDVSILEGIAERYFGAKDEIYTTYVKRWLVSAVARIFEPGCKVDTGLFLHGGQGVKKSTFFKVLAGSGSGTKFFSDSIGGARSEADEIKLLHKFWIHEWSELETVFKRKEIAAIKSFMSRDTDTARFAYRRDEVDLLRQSVFCGSTNEKVFLNDNTGDRRFWIIPISKEDIPLDILRKERDQIWAAAVALYRSGYQHWLTKAEEKLSSEANSEFRNLDPWHEKIEGYIAHCSEVTTSGILTECFKFEDADISRVLSMRVSGVLTSLGWSNISTKRNGRSVRIWLPPVTEPSIPNIEPVQTIEPTTEPIAEPVAEPIAEPVAEPIALFIEPAKVSVGDEVVYFGSKYPVLQAVRLKVNAVTDSYCVCEKPDGRFTTNLPLTEIAKTDEV